MKYIGTNAFISYNDTSGIEAVEVLAEEPPFLQGIADGPFPKTWPITCTIPCGTLSAYQNSRWGTVYTNMSFMEDCNAVEEYANSGIRVYPNPASDVIYIEGMADGNKDLYVYDMLGNVVVAKTSSNNDVVLNISDLSRGFYVIKIVDEMGTVRVAKVCKE